MLDTGAPFLDKGSGELAAAMRNFEVAVRYQMFHALAIVNLPDELSNPNNVLDQLLVGTASPSFAW